MSGRASVLIAFRRQASSCRRLGSPFTGDLLETLADLLDDGTKVGKAILDWPADPVADALALRLAGALHALVLTERSPELIAVYPPGGNARSKGARQDDRHAHRRLREAIESAFDVHADTILRFIQSPPQTNEVARSAALAAGFLEIAARTERPLAIFEIGASAGLNLHWDRFGYDLGGLRFGHGKALPLLTPSWTGLTPSKGDVQVRERAGCDQAPIDLRSTDEVLRLRAYIWPDQEDRQVRLDQALAVAKAHPVSIERADAADWAAARLARRRDGATTVLFHSIVWQYIPKDSQQSLERTIEEAGRHADRRSPFAWLRMEPETEQAAALSLTLWPTGSTTKLAEVDYHGRWIRWHAGPLPR